MNYLARMILCRRPAQCSASPVRVVERDTGPLLASEVTTALIDHLHTVGIGVAREPV